MALTKYNYNSFDVTPVASAALAFNSDADGFTAAASGSMVLIKTLTASGDATLSFVHGSSDVVFDSTYPIYIIKWINAHPSDEDNDAHATINFTIDGSNWNVTKHASWCNALHDEADTSTTFAYNNSLDIQNATGEHKISSNTGDGNDECSSGTLWIFDPSSTVSVKHFNSICSDYTVDGFMQHVWTGGYANTTSALTGVRFSYSNSAEYDAGTFKLYGIKDS